MGQTILIVEDEPHMVRLISYVLEAAGYTVDTADNGVSALELLQGGRPLPDLVVCDIAMPEMDGFETLAAIRAQARLAQLPVIMLTARGQAKDVERALAAGANMYLTKPFSSSELLNAVKEYLDNQGRQAPQRA